MSIKGLIHPIICAFLLIPSACSSGFESSRRGGPTAIDEVRTSTYSIVARDPETGELGVAVQSHWFQVGTMVPWVEAGVGAVATQALTNASFGPRGLAALRAGMTPEQVLEELLATDPRRDQRQVAIVDARGRVAVWTGNSCLPAAGHSKGAAFSVQANMMSSVEVWPAMKRAFERTDAPLAERLVAALAAAERAGGDMRGAQSAALLVAPAKSTGSVLPERSVDIRVADHPRPVEELARLLRLRRAYDASAAGDTALAAGDGERARQLYAKARRLAEPQRELGFWQAVSLFDAGQREPALRLFEAVFEAAPQYRRVLETLPHAGILTRAQVREIVAREER